VRSRADLIPSSGYGTSAVTERPARGVVDASVLIAHRNREEWRYEKSRELLLDAEEGRVELWAPMVIQVEVTRWSQEVDPSAAEARAKLDAFLESDWLHVVEVDRRMAKIARDVVAATPVRTGVDALYVATAVIFDAQTVFTWDDRLQAVEYEAVKGAEPPGATTPRLDLDRS
jgi:predicted nucleic acid-binding protein